MNYDYTWALNELGYQEDLTFDEVKKRYRTLSKKYHPDINPEVDPETFKTLSRAFEDIKKKQVKPHQNKKNTNYQNTSLNELYKRKHKIEKEIVSLSTLIEQAHSTVEAKRQELLDDSFQIRILENTYDKTKASIKSIGFMLLIKNILSNKDLEENPLHQTLILLGTCALTFLGIFAMLPSFPIVGTLSLGFLISSCVKEMTNIQKRRDLEDYKQEIKYLRTNLEAKKNNYAFYKQSEDRLIRKQQDRAVELARINEEIDKYTAYEDPKEKQTQKSGSYQYTKK